MTNRLFSGRQTVSTAILVHRTISMYHQKRPVVVGVLIGYGLIFTAGLVLATLVCTTIDNGEHLLPQGY